MNDFHAMKYYFSFVALVKDPLQGSFIRVDRINTSLMSEYVHVLTRERTSRMDLGVSDDLTPPQRRDPRSEPLAPTAAYPVHATHHPRDMAVFLKDNKGLRRVMINDLIYLEADGNYVEVYLRGGRVVLRNSMTEVLKCLPENIFFLVNRSQAVNVLLLDGIGTDEVNMGQRSFTLTRRYREDLLRHLNIIAGR